MGSNKRFFHVEAYRSLGDILTDRALASTGDAFTNLVCSLAVSRRTGRPVGIKVKGSVLAEALRRAQMRGFAPSGMSRHDLADAVEAFIVYGWLSGAVTFEQCVDTIGETADLTEGLAELTRKIKHRIKLS